MGDSWLWRLKTRLQWTGWLQYLAPLIPCLFLSLVAASLHLVAVGTWASKVLWVFALMLLARVVFDVCTVKLNLRPPERLPERQDHLDVFDLMRERRSCRSFQTRRLTKAHLSELMECAQHHTSNISPPGRVRLEYVTAPLRVWPVVNASEFLVAIAPAAYDRGAVIEVGRRLQKVVLHATHMGLATCWIGPGADQTSVAEHLGSKFDAETDHIICVCAIGYESSLWPLICSSVSKWGQRRLPVAELFFADRHLQQPLDVGVAPFDRFGRCYEACQWSPSSFNAQPVRCVGVLDESGQAHRFDFCPTSSSRFYEPVALGIWCANWETGCEALGIRGHFEVLQKPLPGTAALPDRCDVSWIVDACPTASAGSDAHPSQSLLHTQHSDPAVRPRRTSN